MNPDTNRSCNLFVNLTNWLKKLLQEIWVTHTKTLCIFYFEPDLTPHVSSRSWSQVVPADSSDGGSNPDVENVKGRAPRSPQIPNHSWRMCAVRQGPLAQSGLMKSYTHLLFVILSLKADVSLSLSVNVNVSPALSLRSGFTHTTPLAPIHVISWGSLSENNTVICVFSEYSCSSDNDDEVKL